MKSQRLLIASLLAAGTALPLLADTEWMVTPSHSTSGRMMLHAQHETPVGKTPPSWISYDKPTAKTHGFLRIGNKE